jgi:hypothetical protein
VGNDNPEIFLAEKVEGGKNLKQKKSLSYIEVIKNHIQTHRERSHLKEVDTSNLNGVHPCIFLYLPYKRRDTKKSIY